MIASNVGKFNLSGPGFLHPMNEMNEWVVDLVCSQLFCLFLFFQFIFKNNFLLARSGKLLVVF